MAAGGDAAALTRLGALLPDPAFLASLDDTTDPQLAFSNLDRVFLALAKHPSKATESVCLRVISTKAFQAHPERIIFALPALAAVCPMSGEAATVFSRTNGEGYIWSNGILLAANGSARAMSLLKTMFADRSHRVMDRIDMSHEALVQTAPDPHRPVVDGGSDASAPRSRGTGPNFLSSLLLLTGPLIGAAAWDQESAGAEALSWQARWRHPKFRGAQNRRSKWSICASRGDLFP